VVSPKFTPIRLSRRSKPFDSDDWIFELKHDGFRGLAFVENGRCQLVWVANSYDVNAIRNPKNPRTAAEWRTVRSSRV
jgi:hypothetical protein